MPSARLSFVVKVTKALSGSVSIAGFAARSTPGSLPASNEWVFGAGYKQGAGIVVAKDNVTTDTVLIADAALTDGAEYRITIYYDNELGIPGDINKINVRVMDSSGGFTVTHAAQVANPAFFTMQNLLLRTSVAAGGLRSVRLEGYPGNEIDFPTWLAVNDKYTTGNNYLLRIPARPLYPMRIVFACHGFGSNSTEAGLTSTLYRPTWEALEAAGFCVLVHDMGWAANSNRDLWGNDSACANITNTYTLLRSLWDIHPRVYLWGTSMGGGAAATLIAKGLPVSAAYLAQPVLDLEWAAAQAAFTASLATAYATTEARDANDPMKQAASAFGGVPLLVTASPSDTSVTKADNADAFLAKVGAGQMTLLAATGNHNDPSHFLPSETVSHFQAHY